MLQFKEFLNLTAIFKKLLVIRKNYIIFLYEPYGCILKIPPFTIYFK